MADGHVISGSSITVVNEFIGVPQLSELFGSDTRWSYGVYPGLQGSEHPSLYVHLCGSKETSDKAVHDEVLRASPGLEAVHSLWQLIKSDLAADYGLVRAYANGHAFGQEGAMHHDAKPSDHERLAVVYLNPEWKDSWAGEAVFFDPARECISIRPRPGRLMMFDAALAHTSRPPSRACPTLCATISFHMRRTS